MTVQTYVQDGSTLSGSASIQGNAVPNLTKRIIRAATICNSTASPVSASVWLVPQSGSPDATNVMISARTVSPGESYPCPELVNQGMNAGASLQALGNGLTFKYTATDIS